MREKPKTKIKWFSRFSLFVLKIMRYLIFFSFKFNYFTFFFTFVCLSCICARASWWEGKLQFLSAGLACVARCLENHFWGLSFSVKAVLEKAPRLLASLKETLRNDFRWKGLHKQLPIDWFSRKVLEGIPLLMTETKSNWLWILMRRSWFKGLPSLVFTAKIFFQGFHLCFQVKGFISNFVLSKRSQDGLKRVGRSLRTKVEEFPESRSLKVSKNWKYLIFINANWFHGNHWDGKLFVSTSWSFESFSDFFFVWTKSFQFVAFK